MELPIWGRLSPSPPSANGAAPKLLPGHSSEHCLLTTQVLAALQAGPLDRFRLMQVLFLTWHRCGRPQASPFNSQPHLYVALEDLERRGLVRQVPDPRRHQVQYHLTAEGRQRAVTSRELAEKQREQIAEIARWVATQNWPSLLERVYKEAPDYAMFLDVCG
ncbi:MAG: hypothetical protein HY335_01410 [Deinococcus sp.]|nr:hypothetical protein [Deinococcus sp.]